MGIEEEYNWFVDTDWLSENLNRKDLVVFDATWYLPAQKNSAKDAYLDEHIKDALFFDIDGLCNTQSDFPHMLPSPVQFSSRMRRLGVGDGMTIIIYDRPGLFSAPRVWWTLKTMGFDRVKILNGGLKKWIDEGRPVSDLPHRPRIERHFSSRFQRNLVADLETVKAAIDDDNVQIIDARPKARFNGVEPEPRADLRKGHIPSSISLPFHLVVNEDGTIKTKAELTALIKERDIDLNKKLITTCGSGITASILFLVLSELGAKSVSVYDGSWAEWGANYDLPHAQVKSVKLEIS